MLKASHSPGENLSLPWQLFPLASLSSTLFPTYPPHSSASPSPSAALGAEHTQPITCTTDSHRLGKNSSWRHPHTAQPERCWAKASHRFSIFWHEENNARIPAAWIQCHMKAMCANLIEIKKKHEYQVPIKKTNPFLCELLISFTPNQEGQSKAQ